MTLTLNSILAWHIVWLIWHCHQGFYVFVQDCFSHMITFLINDKYFSDKNTRTSQPVTVSFLNRGLLKILCKETVLITWSYWNTPHQTIRCVIRYWLYWGDQKLSYLLAKKRRDNFALLFFIINEFQEKASSRAMFMFFLRLVKNWQRPHKLINTFVKVVKVKHERIM